MITNARQKPISWDDKKIGPLISGQDVRHQIRNFEFPSPASAHLDCNPPIDRTFWTGQLISAARCPLKSERK